MSRLALVVADKVLGVIIVILCVLAVGITILGIWGQIVLDGQEQEPQRFRVISVQDGAARNERLYVYEDTQTGRLYLYSAGFHRAGLCELNPSTVER